MYKIDRIMEFDIFLLYIYFYRKDGSDGEIKIDYHL